MNLSGAEQEIEKEYHVSWYIIAYKGMFGLVEFLFGVGITFFGRQVLTWYRVFSARELSEDPHDLLVRLSENIVPNVLARHSFLALYLLLLGGAKIAGAIGLVYRKNWGIDLLVFMTICMFPFQFVRLLLHPSIADFLYIFVGIFIALYLINFKPHAWVRRMRLSLHV